MEENETLGEVLSLLMEAQMQIALVLADAFPNGPPSLLTDRVSAKFLRMAALLEGDTSLPMPSAIAVSLHTNGLRLRDLKRPD